ncbi:hypothetical protein [Brachyspira sp.]|uniref:hypothetical protein n=1 Tax=Brachyspira sp. TaxID=1977261 RepID=UPI003D7CD516
MRNIKTIFIVVFSLILLFAVSCSNEDKTGVTGGVPATDLPNGYYQGNLTCKSYIMGDDFFAAPSQGANKKQELEQSYKDWFTTDFFYLKIANNKLKWTKDGDEQYIENMEEVGALKSGSEYSVTYSSEEDEGEYGITKTKETIRFTISGDTISITTYTYEESSERKEKLKYSVVATYEGTLDNYTTYFPKDLEGTYRDDKVASLGGHDTDTKVSYDEPNKRTKIIGAWIKDGATTASGGGLQSQTIYIEKWKKTTKGGKTIKLEGEYDNGKGRKYTVIYDYDSGTLSGTYTSSSGDRYSFNGKKI